MRKNAAIDYSSQYYRKDDKSENEDFKSYLKLDKGVRKLNQENLGSEASRLIDLSLSLSPNYIYAIQLPVNVILNIKLSIIFSLKSFGLLICFTFVFIGPVSGVHSHLMRGSFSDYITHLFLIYPANIFNSTWQAEYNFEDKQRAKQTCLYLSYSFLVNEKTN